MTLPSGYTAITAHLKIARRDLETATDPETRATKAAYITHLEKLLLRESGKLTMSFDDRFPGYNGPRACPPGPGSNPPG